jgi:hypothetical protein
MRPSMIEKLYDDGFQLEFVSHAEAISKFQFSWVPGDLESVL